MVWANGALLITKEFHLNTEVNQVRSYAYVFMHSYVYTKVVMKGIARFVYTNGVHVILN